MSIIVHVDSWSLEVNLVVNSKMKLILVYDIRTLFRFCCFFVLEVNNQRIILP